MKDNLIYYSLIFSSILLTLCVFYLIYLNSDLNYSDSFADQALFWSKFFWFSGALVAVTNIVGLLIYGSPNKINTHNTAQLFKKGWNKQKLLVIVYVSRGDNYQALERSIVHSANLLDQYQISYRIDVVTDIPVSHLHGHNHEVTYHVVPNDYETNRNSKYKARALHYVVSVHQATKLHGAATDNWILHLDEESMLHSSVLAGIHKFINDPKNKKSVGQGEIKYNAYNYGANTLITIMDAIRTGDDLGRFRFQYRLFNKPLFGMHGSFILIPSSIEQKYGFDLGGKGSITEDAYFAIVASSDDVPFKWVDGYIREQSPYSLSAIIKQRRRWYCGLMYLAFDKGIRLRSRLLLILNMLLWTVAWVGPIVTVLNLIFGGYFPAGLFIVAAILQGFYTSVYMVGLRRNLEDVAITRMNKIKLYLLTFLLMPVVNLIEGVSIFYGIIRPVKHFDVVNKN